MLTGPIPRTPIASFVERCSTVVPFSASGAMHYLALPAFAEEGAAPRVWDRENRRSRVNGKPFLLADARLGRVF